MENGGFIAFMKESFWHVLPVLICGAAAVAIIAERTRALFRLYPLTDATGFFDKLRELVLSGKLSEAISVCDRLPQKPAAQVSKQALLRAHQPESLIEQGIQLAVGEATQAIQKRTSFLATIANVATLMGLFGTIAGLIQSFEAVGHADAQQKSALLAAGISQAMNATMMGLAVAIPCMIAFSLLVNRTNQLISQVEDSAMRTLDLLKQRYYAAESELLDPRLNPVMNDDVEDAQDALQDAGASKNGSGRKTPRENGSLRRVA